MTPTKSTGSISELAGIAGIKASDRFLLRNKVLKSNKGLVSTLVTGWVRRSLTTSLVVHDERHLFPPATTLAIVHHNELVGGNKVPEGRFALRLVDGGVRIVNGTFRLSTALSANNLGLPANGAPGILRPVLQKVFRRQRGHRIGL